MAVGILDSRRRGHHQTRDASVNRGQVDTAAFGPGTADDKEKSASVWQELGPGMLVVAERFVHARQLRNNPVLLERNPVDATGPAEQYRLPAPCAAVRLGSVGQNLRLNIS